jgi:hypothetical protein|eukprot:COSAG06_NODE_6424_length_2938_cov_4.027827_3_plen_83_part_00
MSTGGSRQGPFFTDTLTAFAFGLLPKFYDYLTALPQPSRLPPSSPPSDYIGTYAGDIGAENAFFEPFYTKNDRYTKTGSGQA